MSQEEFAIKEKIKPILEQMVYHMVIDRPQNPVNFMIEHLQKLGKYTSNGLTVDEKLELEMLRKEIKKYREMEETNETENIHDKSLSDEDDDEDDVDDHIEKKVINAKARMTKQREAVSAEAYGIYNKKELFIPKFIAKSDDQIQRIKARVLQSFIFAALDSKDLAIVIGSMDEKHFKEGEIVIEQGENGDCLYIIETGELDCFKSFVSVLILIYRLKEEK